MGNVVTYYFTPVSPGTYLGHDAGVFGAPWYVCEDEPFRGQDRLDFIARKLAK